MNRYLTIHIPETAVPMPVSRFLHTQAGLTKKQISQAKFRPGGIKKNGQQCRVTETAYPGDQIMVCLETDDVDSAQLESATFTVNSDRHKSCFHHSTDSTFCSYSTSDACCLSASPSHFFSELEILYEDQDILAINKPAGIVTHPSGSHYSDSLSNQVASYFRSKGEPTKVRSIGRLDKEPPVSCSLPRTRLLPPDCRTSVKRGFQRKPIWLRFPVPCLWMQMEHFTESQFLLRRTRITA